MTIQFLAQDLNIFKKNDDDDFQEVSEKHKARIKNIIQKYKKKKNKMNNKTDNKSFQVNKFNKTAATDTKFINMVGNKYDSKHLKNDSINNVIINKRPKPAFWQRHSIRQNKEHEYKIKTEKPALQSRRFYKNSKNSTQG